VSATEQQQPAVTTAGEVLIRPRQERDVDVADRVIGTAFGTILGVPDAISVFGDAEFVRPRFAAERRGA
jgi:hypothetical protein